MMSSLEDGNHLMLTKQLIASLDSVSSQTSSTVAWNVVMGMITGFRIELDFIGDIVKFLELVLVTISIVAASGPLETDS